MNIKAFFVDALTSALELGIGTPADVIRHVTPDVLAAHLPRPLWARLLTACLGAPRVDAQLLVETIGVPNLCEHVPATIIWSCIGELAARSLGKTPEIEVAPASAAGAQSASPTPSPTSERPGVLAPPPKERPAPPPAVAPVAVGPSIPAPSLAMPTGSESLADVINELEQTDTGGPPSATARPRAPSGQRFRQSSTSVGRLGSSRRPQASASASGAVSASATSPAGSTATHGGSSRRVQTEVNESVPDETQVGADNGHDWPSSGGATRDLAVDDSQLVDWQSTDGNGSSALGDEDFSDIGRKR